MWDAENYGLVNLYSTFSEDKYCAQWMGDPEEYAEEFKEWLQERLQNPEDNSRWYELEGLSTLQRLYKEVLLEWPLKEY